MADRLLDTYINVGEVDCQSEAAACERVEVNGYPTIYLFEKNKAYQFAGARTFENIMAFLNNRNYVKYGKTSKILKQADIPNSYLARLYTDLTKYLNGNFKSVRLEFLPNVLQVIIAFLVICSPIVLILYAVCSRDEEYEKLKAQIDAEKAQREAEFAARKTN